MTLTVAGDAGATLAPSGRPFVYRVADLDPGSPAAMAGLHDGDEIDARRLPPSVRYRLGTGIRAGERVTLPVSGPGVSRTATFTTRPLTQSAFWRNDGWDQVLSIVGELWNLLVAALIIWRRRDRTDALILAALLVLGDFGVALTPANYWITPWAAVDAVANAVGTGAEALGTVLLATYALQFGRPVSRLRRWLTGVAYAEAAFGAVQFWAGLICQWLGTADPNTWLLAQPGPAIALIVVPYLLPVACAALALRDTRGSDRVRLAWASGSIAVGFSAYVLFAIAKQLDAFVHVGTLVVDVTEFAVPLVLTYALLNRSLLDVGFVLNRASIAAVLSALGVAIFAGIEWILSAFFARLGSTGVLTINIAAAILLGLMAPSLYRLTGTMVERTFFGRQRGAREQAARIAAGLPYVDSASTLATALTRDICKVLELPSGAVFRRNAGGNFVREAAAGWDDGERLHAPDVERIVLQLLADRSPLRLSEGQLDARPAAGSDGTPALVFPLEARQELIGFVAYSVHAGGIDVDPDERALLLELTRQASRGYDALELATRVENAYRARMAAEAEVKETLRRTNAMLERVNEAQARFVPSEFLRFLRRESIVDVVLGDSTLQTMSVMFSDIRAFTTLSEAMTPPEIFAFLNDYMSHIGPLVREHKGFIDKYIGDAVMGLFPSSPSDALRAAIALQQELRIFNLELGRAGKPQVSAGVGIHTGPLMLGTIGERGRMETTVISDAVNVASRLESLTKTFRCSILISLQTREALPDPQAFFLRRLGRADVKGKSNMLDVYECFGGQTPDAVERKVRSSEAFGAAVDAFENGRIREAARDFAGIASVDPDDGPARYYLTRCGTEPEPATRKRSVI
jgi:class 3 adenylate cyclase